MTIQEAIYVRKSSRGFGAAPLNSDVLERIKAYAKTVKPLYPDIQTEVQIAGKDKIKSILPWKGPHNLVIFSEMKQGCYENVGFMYQQVELYMQSMGVACCWIGLGKLASGEGEEVTVKPSNSSMKFVIYITFGNAKGELYRELSEFKRKTLAQISDMVDERLEPARLAPSGKDMQPWFFLHDGDTIHAYCVRPGMLKSEKDANINRIDMGCALSHLYVTNASTFKFIVNDEPRSLNGFYYLGSLRI